MSWDNENYYLVAYRKEYDRLAHFRVDKMTEIRLESEKRHPLTQTFDPADYCQRTFGMFSGEVSLVKLRFSTGLIGVVIDRFGKDVRMIKEDEDWFVASIRVAVSPVFYAWLIQFGSRAQVLGPPKVRGEIRLLLGETMKGYDL